MSTTELKRLIDERSPSERQWMAAYLLDELRAAPELSQTADELAELSRRRSDLLNGRNRVTQKDAEARWEKPERAERWTGRLRSDSNTEGQRARRNTE